MPPPTTSMVIGATSCAVQPGGGMRAARRFRAIPGNLSGARAPQGDVEEVVAAARRGDPVALDRLVRYLEVRLGPVCGAIALDDGADALQEALMTVVQKLGEL